MVDHSAISSSNVPKVGHPQVSRCTHIFFFLEFINMSNNNFPSKGIQHLQGLLDKIQESVEDSKALTRIAHEKSRSTERYIEDASAFLGRLSPVEWGLAEAKGAGLWLRQQDSDVKSRMRDIEKQLKEMCGDDSTCGLFFPDFKFSSILDAPEQAPKKPPPVENISFRQNATPQTTCKLQLRTGKSLPPRPTCLRHNA